MSPVAPIATIAVLDVAGVGPVATGTTYQPPEQVSVREKGTVLITAAEFHKRIAIVAAELFQNHIDHKELEGLGRETATIGKALQGLDFS